MKKKQKPIENNENHENLRISYQNHETNENLKIPRENQTKH